MNGWGRVVFLITAGALLGSGCGGRTGSAYDELYDPDPDGGTSSGTPGSGGRAMTAGRSTGGSRAGNGPSPTAGNSFGGVGGSFITGGASFGGSFPTGGSFPVAGAFPMGGFGGSFPFPTGGFGGAGGVGGDCQSCLYQTCGDTLLQCFQDIGCIAIFTCMAQTGCDTFDCYSPNTCGPIIDQFGGPFGPSMTTLIDGVSCALTSGCPCN